MKKTYVILILTVSVMFFGCSSGSSSNSSISTSSSSISSSSSSISSSSEDTKATPAVKTTPAVKATPTPAVKATPVVDKKYSINNATYKEQDIEINYPQISNFSDSSKEKIINDLIKTEAMSFLKDYEGADGLDFKINYEIKYQGTDYLSVEYLGLAVVKGTAHPNNLIYTTNIDLAKGEKLVLAQVAHSEDENFAGKFLAGKYVPYTTDLNLETQDALKPVLVNYDNHGLMLILKPFTTKFYLTKDSLVVSIEVPHAVGDHLEMAMDYKSLGDLITLVPGTK